MLLKTVNCSKNEKMEVNTPMTNDTDNISDIHIDLQQCNIELTNTRAEILFEKQSKNELKENFCELQIQ